MTEVWVPAIAPAIGPQHGTSKKVIILLGVLIGVLAFVVAKSVCIIYWCRRRKRQTSRILHPEEGKGPAPSKEELEQVLLNMQDWGADCSDIKLIKGPDGRDLELGSGGFGRVVKGLRNGIQAVAVKMVYNTDEKARQEFIKEIKLLHRISRDSNIVQFFGASIRQNQLWLVTEYMDGGDLRKALTAEPPNNLTWWNGGKEVALDVARGLAFLHSNHVIHRDLKSKNILLTANGTAKIGDVGMAKILTEGELTRDQKVGTFAWAAPELLCGERCTEKADIYSFGLVLWEIATGLMPIRGEVMAPTPEECPPSLIKLIQECMRVNPDLRPAATELYRRLQACEPNADEQPILDSAEAGGNSSSMLHTTRTSMSKSRRPSMATSMHSAYPESLLSTCAETETDSLSKTDSCMKGDCSSDLDSCTKTDSIAGSHCGFDSDSGTAEALNLQEEEMKQGNTAFAQLVASYLKGGSVGLKSGGKSSNRGLSYGTSLSQDIRVRMDLSDTDDSFTCCHDPIREVETETETDAGVSTIGDASSTLDRDIELGLAVPRSTLGNKMAAVANAVANAVEMGLRKQEGYAGRNEKIKGGVARLGDDIEDEIGQGAGNYDVVVGWGVGGAEEPKGKQRRLRTW